MANMLSLVTDIVLDTSVFIAALRSEGGAAREVVRRCLQGRYCPLFGNALWLEYEDVLGRKVVGATASETEGKIVLAAFARAGHWVQVYYGWRPNLRDESDNHLIELAVAGNATAIVTHNLRDLRSSELAWPALRILTPAQCLKELHEHTHHPHSRQHRRKAQAPRAQPRFEREQAG